MSKDKIEVNMNIYDIPIVVEELEKANKWLEKKIKDYSLNSKDLHCLKIIYNLVKEK